MAMADGTFSLLYSYKLKTAFDIWKVVNIISENCETAHWTSEEIECKFDELDKNLPGLGQYC